MSLFQSLYKYRETDKINQKENFQTEIFSHCLNADKEFLAKFLKLLACSTDSLNFSSQTQKSEYSIGRPDIQLVNHGETIIFIECKISAVLGQNQLERYAESLALQNYPNRILVLISKDFIKCPPIRSDVPFVVLRWYEVYNIIASSENPLTKEFAKYLISERMSTKVEFQINELNAIQAFLSIHSKMNEFLDMVDSVMKELEFKPIFTVGDLLKDADYGKKTSITGGFLWVGFLQYDDDEEIKLCVSIEQVGTDANYLRTIEKTLSGIWNSYEMEDQSGITWYIKRSLSSFFDGANFNANAALDFVKNKLKMAKQAISLISAPIDKT